MKTTLAELEAAYIEARDAFVDSDINYRDWIRETSVDDFIIDIDHYLASDEEQEFDLTLDQTVRAVYVPAKVFVIARDSGHDAAMLWKLANGGAV